MNNRMLLPHTAVTNNTVLLMFWIAAHGFQTVNQAQFSSEYPRTFAICTRYFPFFFSWAAVPVVMSLAVKDVQRRHFHPLTGGHFPIIYVDGRQTTRF